jgi:hypothetical protein
VNPLELWRNRLTGAVVLAAIIVSILWSLK